MDRDEPKTVVSVSREDLGDLPPNESEEPDQNWNFLIPFLLPILFIGIVAVAFVSFGKGEKGPLAGVDLNTATASGKVAGTQTKLPLAGPNVPPATKPSPNPSPSPKPSPSPAPSPSPEPSPSPDPSPSPSPSPSPEPSPSESPSPSPES